eukprot:g78031.t1
MTKCFFFSYVFRNLVNLAKHWKACYKFPQIAGLEVSFSQALHKDAGGGYELKDVSCWRPQAECVACAEQRRAAFEKMPAREEKQRTAELALQARRGRKVYEAMERKLGRKPSIERVQEPLLKGELPSWLSDDEAAVMPVLTYTPGARHGQPASLSWRWDAESSSSPSLLPPSPSSVRTAEEDGILKWAYPGK